MAINFWFTFNQIQEGSAKIWKIKINRRLRDEAAEFKEAK
jgi:hypothetical protein